MGILGEAIGRDGRGPVAARAPAASPRPAPPSTLEDAPAAARPSDLARRREALAAEVTELHWDLGGLAYEMAIRDHFRLDVLVRRAGVLQERDAELAEVERLLRMEQEGAAGSCPVCGAPHSRGALFCWQCGTGLMERLPSATAVEGNGSAAVLDELLSSPAGADGADR